MTQTYRVQWSRVAAKDLERIIAHIAKECPETAADVLAVVKAAVAKLYHYPNRGRIVPELQDQGISLYRELVIPPWRVMYRIVDATVLVLAVFDSRQNIEDILLRRLAQKEE